MRYLGDELGLKQRWQLWRKRRVVFPPDEIHQAGENAELRLEKLCRAAGKTNRWSVYPSVRIPDPDGGRREIDLILVSGSTVLVVEQKHWSGRFEVFEDGEKSTWVLDCGLQFTISMNIPLFHSCSKADIEKVAFEF